MFGIFELFQVWYDIFTYEAFQGEKDVNVPAGLDKVEHRNILLLKYLDT